MTREVRVCRAGDSLSQAAQLMWDGDCGCVPVVDASFRVLGVLTDRDVCMAAYLQGKPLSSLSVAQAMARTVFSVKPGDDLQTALRSMAEHQVRRLPVVGEDGRLAGVLALSDLVRAAARKGKGGGRQSKAAEVFAALAAISAPRPGPGAPAGD